MSEIPQTVSSEIGDAINALIATSDHFRQWDAPEIQSLVRASEKLQKVDARQAFVHLGMLAAICGDTDRLMEYFRKALNLPGELETRHEFWVALANAGVYSKASEIGSWLLDPKRGFFSKVWERAVGAGHLLETWTRLPDAKKTYPDLSDVDFSMLEDAIGVMRERGLSDRDVVSVLSLMGDVQRAHRVMFAGNMVSKLKVMRPPEEPPYIYFSIPIDATVGEIHSMNREFASLIVEKTPDGAFPQGVVTTFAKAQSVGHPAVAWRG